MADEFKEEEEEEDQEAAAYRTVETVGKKNGDSITASYFSSRCL